MTRARFGLAGVLLLCAVAPGVADDQTEQFTPEFRKLHTTVDPKHTPKIEAPDSVKRGQWFDVTVTVAHPSLAEHFVRVYFHPVFSQPRVRFTIALDEGGTLRALAEPTHSAAWEASRPIRVVP
jgi:superoxide reductase